MPKIKIELEKFSKLFLSKLFIGVVLSFLSFHVPTFADDGDFYGQENEGEFFGSDEGDEPSGPGSTSNYWDNWENEQRVAPSELQNSEGVEVSAEVVEPELPPAPVIQDPPRLTASKSFRRKKATSPVETPSPVDAAYQAALQTSESKPRKKPSIAPVKKTVQAESASALDILQKEKPKAVFSTLSQTDPTQEPMMQKEKPRVKPTLKPIRSSVVPKPVESPEPSDIEILKTDETKKGKRKRIKKKKLKVKKNVFAEEFYMDPEAQLTNDVVDIKGFLFQRTPSSVRDTNYSIVTGFHKNIMKTRYVPGLDRAKDVEKWIEASLEEAEYEGVDIRRLTLPSPVPGKPGTPLFWVGHRSYGSPQDAQNQISTTKALVEFQGDDFAKMVEKASRYIRRPEKKAPIEIKSKAQFEKEEKIALDWMDKMDFGEKLFGPFQGTSTGEPIIWQSFGETSWRNTNFEAVNFNDQVGFWANRLIFKGIRAPFNTINPFLEVLTVYDTTGVDFKSNFQVAAGLEWRPFGRAAWTHNYRPWSLPLLIWIRNYRFYVQYVNARNIKDEVADADAHNLLWGVSIFYEFGIDPPPIAEQKPEGVPDYIRKYIWGEYFGDYRWETTNLSTLDDFDAFIFNSSFTLGFKLPGIPLPPNPITDEMILMPYMRYEHVNNFSFRFDFQNNHSMSAGLRWMPFSNYRWKESEWLSKIKIFFEFNGVGLRQHVKQIGEVPNAIRRDFRVGVNYSSRRF